MPSTLARKLEQQEQELHENQVRLGMQKLGYYVLRSEYALGPFNQGGFQIVQMRPPHKVVAGVHFNLSLGEVLGFCISQQWGRSRRWASV